MSGGRHRPWSLAARLTRRVMAGLCLAWMLSLGVGLWVLDHEINEILDENLEDGARLVQALVAAGQPVPGTSEALHVRIGDAPAPWPDLESDLGPDQEADHYEGAGWHVLRLPPLAGGPRIEVGQSTGWRRDELMESARALFALMLLVLVAGWVSIRLGLRPVLASTRVFADQLGHRGATDLTPLPETGLPAEMLPVPRALNAYLGRIEALLANERRFAADAAHELRTPIASAMAQAQILSQRLQPGQGAADAPHDPDAARDAERLIAALDRLRRLVERLLQLSRAEANIARTEARADLVTILHLLIGERAGRGIRFDDGDLDHLSVAVEPDSLAILLANLLDNAVEHGTGGVLVRLAPEGRLEIRNPVGPGAAFDHARFAKRGASPGAGLGLSIIEAITCANGLRLEHAMRGSEAVVSWEFADLLV